MTEGVVLSGGGAYGAFEAGVLRALCSGCSPATGFRPLDPMVMAGTSAGAFNAAVFVSRAREGANRASEYLERVWIDRVAESAEGCANGVLRYRVSPPALRAGCPETSWTSPLTDLFADASFLMAEGLRRGAVAIQSSEPPGARLASLIDTEPLISAAPFVSLVGRTVDLNQIVSSKVAVRIAATNWRTGKVRVFSNFDLASAGHAAVLASSAIPGVFPSVEIGGEPYVDGGIAMNTPIKPAIRAGADVLHVVYVNPEVSRVPLPAASNTASTFFRFLATVFAVTFEDDLKYAAEINRALRTLREGPGPGESGARRAVEAVRVALDDSNREPFRELVIHRYSPAEPAGVAGWLDFARGHVERLVELGFREAVEHDCARNRCVGVGYDA